MVLFIPEQFFFLNTTIFDQVEIPWNNKNTIFTIDVWIHCDTLVFFYLLVYLYIYILETKAMSKDSNMRKVDTYM